MSEESTNRLAESRRMEVFRALVEAQDGEMSVSRSREVIAQRFDLTVKEVQTIEREGLDRQWPPL